LEDNTATRLPGDIESILPALHHEDPNVRWEAARALGILRDPRAVEPLLVMLNDRDPDVRRKAALSLAKIRDPRALEPLRACSVRDENQVVRWAAAWGLGRFQERKSA
jgi:HEAT repeat protein